MIFHCYQSDPQSSNCFMLTSQHIVDLLQPKGPLCITSHIIRPVLLASCGCLRWGATSANTCSTPTTPDDVADDIFVPRNGWAHVLRSIALKGWEVPKITTTESDAMLNVMTKVAGMQNAKRCKKCIWWQSPNPKAIRISLRKKGPATSKKSDFHRFSPTRCLNQRSGEGRKSEYYFPAHATQPFQSPRAAQTILNCPSCAM